MAFSREEIEEDIKELKLFQGSVSCQRNINLLGDELKRCEKILQCVSLLEEDSARFGTKELQQSVSHQPSSDQHSVTAPTKSSVLPLGESDIDDICASHDAGKTDAANNATTTNDPVIRTETITNYGWDQTPKLIKLRVPVVGVRKSDKVSCSFTGNTCSIIVSKVNNKNYSLVINNLARPIIARKSCHETQNDEVIVKLFKAETNKQWPAVTALEAGMLPNKSVRKVEAKATESMPGNSVKATESKSGNSAKAIERKPDNIAKATGRKPDNRAKSTNDVDQDISPEDGVLVSKIRVENIRWTSRTGNRAKKNEHRVARTVAPNVAFKRALVVCDHEMAEKAIEMLNARPSSRTVFIRMSETGVPVHNTAMIHTFIHKLATFRLPSHLYLRCFDSFWMRGCHETLIKDDSHWFNALLQSIKVGKCKGMDMYVNLEAATIRKLPSIVSLGLAVARRDQYDAIQELQPYKSFELSIARNLDVSGYPPLKPWAYQVVLHFYGLRDCDLDWMICSVRTLTNDRICHIVLPGSELTVKGCAHLAARIYSVNAQTIQIDSPYLADMNDQNSLKYQFVCNGTMVRWSLETIYYWYEIILNQD